MCVFRKFKLYKKTLNVFTWTILIILASIPVHPVFAAKKTKGIKEQKINLLQAIMLAVEKNPQIRESWLNYKITESDYKIKKSAYYPSIDITGNYTNSEIDYKNDGATNKTRTESLSPGVTVSYLLFDFGVREAEIREFKHKMQASGFDNNSTLQNLIYSVINSYYTLFSNEATLQSAIKNEEFSLAVYKAASLKYKLGLVPLTDKLQAETSHSESKLNRQKAENNLKITSAKFNYLLHLNPNHKLNLSKPNLKKVKNENLEKDVNKLMTTALKNRPEMLSALQSKKASLESLKASRRQRYPSISLNGSHSYINDLRRINNDYDKSSVGVNLTLPLFAGGSIYNDIAKSKHELSLIDTQIQDLEKEIKLDVWEAFQNFKTAKSTLTTARKLVKSAETTAKTTLGMYKNGKASILDVLEAKASAVNARQEFISSRHDVFTTRANLIRAVGKSNLGNFNLLIQ